MRPYSHKIVVDERVAAYLEYKCLLPASTGSKRWKPVNGCVRKACEGCGIEAHTTAGVVAHGMDVQGEGLVPPAALSSHPPSFLHEVAYGNGLWRSHGGSASRRAGEILALGVEDA